MEAEVPEEEELEEDTLNKVNNLCSLVTPTNKLKSVHPPNSSHPVWQ
jgi:hypothetical protein